MSIIFRSMVLVAVLLFSIIPVFAEDSDKTLSPYFLVDGEPGVEQLPLKDTRVEIGVTGVIADVTVTQVYRNEGNIPINARYIFPASTRAAVYGMRMIIGNEVIIAKIKEREQARVEFDQAKKEGKSASLLEQQRPNVFSMSLANLLPGEQVQIELRYTELLIPTDQVYEFVFPTVVGPRYSSQPEGQAPESSRWVKSPYLQQGELPRNQFHLDANISTGVPIQDLQTPSHKLNAKWKNPAQVQLTLDETEASQANRDFILRYRLAGEQIASGLMLFQGEDENFFLYMVQPPARIADADIPTREYVFVVDVSGSMYGFPLDTAKSVLRKLIGSLREQDRFNVVLFAGSSTALSEESIPANAANVQAALRVLDNQSGGGGTELLQGLQRATRIPRQPGVSRTVLVITDGYIEAERDVFEYIRSNLDECNFFAFGIGSSVNRYLIEGVARAGRGEPFVVTNPSEAPQVAEKFQQYIQTPILTDIKFHAKGIDLYEVSPGKLPDLFAQRPVIVFGKWRGAAKGEMELEGISAGRPYFSIVDASAARPDKSHAALRYLWARWVLAELSDFGAADPETDQKITNLGLKYNLLTKKTSFIAVRERITNQQGNAKDVNQPLPLPEGVSNCAVGGPVVGQSEPELYWLLGIFALIFAISFLMSRKDPQRKSC